MLDTPVIWYNLLLSSHLISFHVCLFYDAYFIDFLANLQLGLLHYVSLHVFENKYAHLCIIMYSDLFVNKLSII